MRGKKTISITNLIVLFIGLALTVGMWQITTNVIYLRQKLRFDAEINEVVRLIELKTKLYESSLRSLRAAYVANKECFDYNNFNQYVDDIAPSLPTFAGFAFYRNIEQKDASNYESEIRKNISVYNNIYKNFKVQNTLIGSKDNNLIIVEYVFPSTNSGSAIGRNILGDSVRRSAVEYALKNDFAITNQVQLTPNIPRAILLYMPVFQSNVKKSDYNARQIQNLYGIIGCGFELNKMLDNILSNEIHEKMYIRINDIGSISETSSKSNYTELYNSNYKHEWLSTHNKSHLLYSSYIYQYGGRKWLIEFQASDNYIQPIFFIMPPVIVILGVLITGLVFSIVVTKNKLSLSNKKLAESEDRFKSIIDTAPLALVMSNLQTGKIIMINQRTTEIFQLENNPDLKQEISLNFYVNPNDRKMLVDNLIMNKTLRDLEFRFKRQNGEEFWALVSATTSTYYGEDVILAGINDISQRKEIENQLRQFATTDGLTGINNRRHFLELANQELHRAIRFKHSISVMMLDIDKFKNINDTYGHDVGDKAIRLMASTCIEMLREFDIVGRLGGEEFGIVLPETEIHFAVKIAERIRHLIAEKEVVDESKNIKFSFTVSIGITSLEQSQIENSTPIDSIEQLLNIADKGLYEAKNNGRNQVCLA